MKKLFLYSFLFVMSFNIALTQSSLPECGGNDNNILELAINGGAEDCLSKGSYHEVITAKDNFYKVKLEMEKKIQDFISSDIEWLPINKISLDQEKIKTVLNFLETLEDDDDVQHVYANLEIDNTFEVKNLT